MPNSKPIQLAALDPERVAELKSIGDETFLNELLKIFRRDLLASRVALNQAIETSDAQLIAKLSHRLKSSAGNVGARDLLRSCCDLENAALASPPDWPGIHRAVADYIQKLEALLTDESRRAA